MDHGNKWSFVMEADRKFEYSFVTLIFTVLALSIQFAPKYGDAWKYLLICSWVLLLISGLIGGYRVFHKLHSLISGYQSRSSNMIEKAVTLILMDENTEQMRSLFIWQALFFLGGIFCNLTFIIINYLKSS